jgi:CRISPR system Cascade subunit CasC
MIPKFIQIHTLTSYPGALLNRDDAGFAKRLPFGGAVRTRISSQCLKRHWRTFNGEGAFSELDVPQSVRSRITFQRQVVEPLVAEGLDEALVRAVTEGFMVEVLGESKKAKAKKKEKEEEGESGALETGQITVLGRPEIEFIRAQVREVCQLEPDPKKAAKVVKTHLGAEGRKNFKEMRLGAGLGAALFGRMVTSDALSRVDAAVHVAHAFTVHGEHSETDYFSAIDDLQREAGELGSGHINSTELTSGLYYGYVVVDLPLLVSNLEGSEQSAFESSDRTLAADVVSRLIPLIATVSPGAKLGSTAPYSSAMLVLVEAGLAQPRTLANAFLDPLSTRGGLQAKAYAALADHIDGLDGMYGKRFERRYAALHATEALRGVLGGPAPLDDVAAWTRGRILGGQS